MKRIAVYVGSFDPVTRGHEDIIRRAAPLCDELHVVVMHNISKKGEFTVEERIALLKSVLADMPHVLIDSWQGLMVDYVRSVGASFVVRGLRNAADFDAEQTLAQLNARLMPDLETIFLLTKPELACISSSAVREAAHFCADYSEFVPEKALKQIKAHYQQKQ